jgi:hypothetical protein
MTIWNQLKQLFGKAKQTTTEPGNATHQAGEAALDQGNLITLMQCLEKTLDNAYSCEEAFAFLDEYAELVVSDEEARQLMPLVKNHLDMCPDCRDELEILLRILKTAD